MKRFLALAALVLGLASCQTEPEGLNVNVGGEVDTTITVTIPDTETRAGGTNSAKGVFDNGVLSGSATMRYIFQVYYNNNEEVVESLAAPQVAYSDGQTVTFPVRLVPGRDYTFVVWADVVDAEADVDKHYITRQDGKINLRNITVNSDSWVAMDESRDAFTVSEVVADYNGAKTIELKLKRPFAKFRVITTDMKALNDLGIEPTYATVTYSTKHYSTFNAVDGSCSGEIANKTHNYFIAPYADHNGNTSKVLFTDYFFANKQDEVVNFTLAVYDEQGYDEVANTYTKNDDYIIKTNNFSTPIPAQRNYLTTISGNILTDGNNVKVDVTDAFENSQNPNDKPYYNEIVEVGNATDLQEAINESTENTTIVLGGDIDLNAGILSTRASEPSYGLLIPAGKEVVLDLNGYTISARDYATAGYALITNKGNLTINGEGTLKITGAENNRGWGAYSSVISNQVGGNLTVNAGVTIEHFGGTDMAYGIDNLTNGKGTSAIVTINGATVKSTYRPIRQFLNGVEATNELYVNKDSRVESTGSNKAIWMQDPSKNANTGKLVVAEGAFVHSVYLDVTPGSTEWPVEVSVAASSLTDTSENKGIYTDGIPAGYEVVLENGVYTVLYTCAAKIGDVEYPSLQAAVDAVEDGETIVLNRNIEQVDGVIITDKNITIDLNNKTFTVSEGANTNNRNFKVNGSSVVTIKNGTMVAAGEITSGAYGTVRTEGTATVNLENVKLYSYRGYGLNVKACTGTTININNSEIYSQYSGGVEAAGGNIEMTNVKIEQKGVYSGGAWCSVAIGVNGNGNVTINSGNYSASTIASDSNAAQGTWVAYVMSSGGTLNIKGGTFNGVVAETAAAANACGLICADRAAVVKIHGGTFNSNGAILDMRNNVGTQPNPKATLFGGTFSADPRISGLYSSNLITVAEGYDVVEKDGKYTVIKPVAQVGATIYEKIDEAIAAWTNNTTLTLKSDVTLSDVVNLNSTEHHILDLGTYTMTAASGKNAFEIIARGTGASERTAITIKADANNPGCIKADSKSVVYYNYANGTATGDDRPIIKIEGGIFYGATSSFGTAGIYFKGGSAARQAATLNISGGEFYCSINGQSKSKLLISGGLFHYSVGSQGDSTALRLISGGTFKTLGFMTADSNNTKFWFGTSMANSNVGVYVDKNDYLVVGGPVITEAPGENWEKKSYSSWSSYLKYSSAATYGLFYEPK